MLLLLLLRLHRPINNVCEQDQRTAARTPQAPKGGHQHELRTLQKISDSTTQSFHHSARTSQIILSESCFKRLIRSQNVPAGTVSSSNPLQPKLQPNPTTPILADPPLQTAQSWGEIHQSGTGEDGSDPAGRWSRRPSIIIELPRRLWRVVIAREKKGAPINITEC